jgi:hypothetical protein
MKHLGECSLKYIGCSIIIAAVFGVILSILFVVFTHYCFCDWFKKTCEAAATNPPWLLLSGLTAAPSVLLTWYWRTVHKEKDLENHRNELLVREKERIVRKMELVQSDIRNAMTLLDSGNLHTRRNGVHELGRIAKDSPESSIDIVNKLSNFLSDPTRGKNLSRDHVRSNPDLLEALSVCVNLGGANFKGINFENGLLKEADLRGADFEKANLKFANLQEARLQGTNFIEANLQEAKLQGTNFVEANLERANLKKARYDSKTVFPKGCDIETAGMIGLPYPA